MTDESMQVNARPASADDEAFLYELYRSTRAEELEAWGLDESQQKSFLELQFAARQRHYDIAFSGAEHKIILCGDRPAGRILVYRSEHEIRLVDIALLPEYRQRGFGASLIRGLLCEAKEKGKAVTLHVDTLNRAGRLYERLGFSVVGDIGGSYKMEWRPATPRKSKETETE
jgi:ribosomal protein S18 acetylase RimI-like enzyme